MSLHRNRNGNYIPTKDSEKDWVHTSTETLWKDRINAYKTSGTNTCLPLWVWKHTLTTPSVLMLREVIPQPPKGVASQNNQRTLSFSPSHSLHFSFSVVTIHALIIAILSVCKSKKGTWVEC